VTRNPPSPANRLVERRVRSNLNGYHVSGFGRQTQDFGLDYRVPDSHEVEEGYVGSKCPLTYKTTCRHVPLSVSGVRMQWVTIMESRICEVVLKHDTLRGRDTPGRIKHEYILEVVLVPGSGRNDVGASRHSSSALGGLSTCVHAPSSERLSS